MKLKSKGEGSPVVVTAANGSLGRGILIITCMRGQRHRRGTCYLQSKIRDYCEYTCESFSVDDLSLNCRRALILKKNISNTKKCEFYTCSFRQSIETYAITQTVKVFELTDCETKEHPLSWPEVLPQDPHLSQVPPPLRRLFTAGYVPPPLRQLGTPLGQLTRHVTLRLARHAIIGYPGTLDLHVAELLHIGTGMLDFLCKEALWKNAKSLLHVLFFESPMDFFYCLVSIVRSMA